MIAVGIVEKLTMLFSLICQYYSGRRGIGTKDKYACAHKYYGKQPNAGPFKNI
jgi:hypothetical protein